MSNRALGLLAALVGVLAVAVLGVFALVAFGGDDDSSAAGDGGSGEAAAGFCSNEQLLTFGSDPLSRLDPIQVRDDSTAQYIVEIFGGLVRLEQDAQGQIEIVPDLAERWELSDDGRTYTFFLRPDALFHDGRRVTADDVKFSLERAADPENASPTAELYLADIAGFRDRLEGRADEVSGIRVVDERTVEIELIEPRSYFLAELTYPVAYVVDRQQVEDDPDGWTRRPNGTGPYRIKTFSPAERIVLVRNERFHLRTPKVEEVVFELAGGSISTRYQNNELHIGVVPTLELEAVKGGDSPLSHDYHPTPQNSLLYFAFNAQSPPFDDPLVRQAMALALDRERINDTLLFDSQRVADGILPPEMPGYEETITSYGYDPDRARDLLAQSKYADDLPRITLTFGGSAGTPSSVLEAAQQAWKDELGLDVELQATDPASFLRDLRTGAFQMYVAGWAADYPDPEDFLDKLFHTDSAQNEFGYSNPEIDQLLEAARGEPDVEARYEDYRQAEQMILDDAPVIPLFWPVEHLLVKPCVHGWQDHPMVMPRYEFLDIYEE